MNEIYDEMYIGKEIILRNPGSLTTSVTFKVADLKLLQTWVKIKKYWQSRFTVHF